jgi:PDZ domain-containing protein
VDEDQATAGPAEPRQPAVQPRTVTMLVCGFAAALLFALVGLLPVPYAIMKPGPVRDTLSTVDGHPLIEVSGRRTYPTDGTLDLTTVSVFGGPGHSVDVVDVVSSWLDPTEAVVPEEELFPPDQTEQEVEEQNSEAMVTSQENATAAAMGELGIAVPTTLTVAGFSDGSHAEGPLDKGDVITAIDGTDVPDLPQLREQLQTVEPGHQVTVSVLRDGEPLDVPVTTSRSRDGDTLLGVLVDPTYHFPFEVSIEIENIGGPSAGMMFALGIVDKLTPGAMTGGEKIAGTGTIDSGGDVGPIGGIQQKLVGARRAGAQWFLAPAGNCAEVAGHVPDGLRVVKVADLDQARHAVEAIGDGEAADLATCG